MTEQEIQKLIASMQPNLSLPPLKRNKSWLLIFADANKEFHFYDTRSSPAEAYTRITAKQPTYRFLDILGFTSLDEATSNAQLLRSAAETLQHYRNQL